MPCWVPGCATMGQCRPRRKPITNSLGRSVHRARNWQDRRGGGRPLGTARDSGSLRALRVLASDIGEPWALRWALGWAWGKLRGSSTAAGVPQALSAPPPISESEARNLADTIHQVSSTRSTAEAQQVVDIALSR